MGFGNAMQGKEGASISICLLHQMTEIDTRPISYDSKICYGAL